MVQQPVQNRRRDDLVTEDRVPVTVAFIRGQDDAALLIPGADQLKEIVAPRSSIGR